MWRRSINLSSPSMQRTRPFAFGEKVLEKPPGVPQPLRLPDGSPNPIWTIKMEYKATWKAFEDMVASGKVSGAR
jgi:hypothetical protein